MAKCVVMNSYPTLLGFRDDEITEKNEQITDFTTSKIGGKMDLTGSLKHSSLDSITTCQLCSGRQALVCQIYAPLEDSQYHRTLYVLACLSPACWEKSESWRCLRIQSLDDSYAGAGSVKESSSPLGEPSSKTSWFEDEDDWGDDGGDDWNDPNGNVEEANPSSLDIQSLSISNVGTTTEQVDNLRSPTSPCEQSSLSESGSSEFSRSDSNYNLNEGGAVSNILMSAEIEDDQEGCELTTVEDIQCPNTNLPALLRPSNDNAAVHIIAAELNPFFIAVQEETLAKRQKGMSEHERKLLLEYETKEHVHVPSTPSGNAPSASDNDGYEKAIPKHGDVSFYKMASTIAQNPGQIIRYSRDPEHKPLLMEKLQEFKKTCPRCMGPLSCELQLLPTLVSMLSLKDHCHSASALEFGTVLVFTCWQSCWRREDVFCEEKVIVQTEQV